MYCSACRGLWQSCAGTSHLKHDYCQFYWSLPSTRHVTCDTAVIGHAVAKNLLFFTSSTAVCGCLSVNQLHCTLPRSDVTSTEACTVFSYYIYTPAGFCAAGTCGRDSVPDHCDRTQAKQVWSLYDILAPFQETLNFVASSSRSLTSACLILQCSFCFPLTYAD